MNKRLVMAVLAIFIFMAGGCSQRFEEEAVAKTKAENPKLASSGIQVPVKKDFMPNMNFVPRSDIKTHVVLHFISNAANNPKNPYVYEEIRQIFIDYDVSPHYMIDRDGDIYFLLPESRRARHAGKGELLDFPDYKDSLNDYSIGIELMAIGTEAEMKSVMTSNDYKKIPQEHIGYTEAQYKSLNLLLDDILARNKKVKRDRIHIIGHDEYAQERKTDPGNLFTWSKIVGEKRQDE
ncbi:N-acetylmuramoyl-L-alanine amidase [Mesobacillus sp. AQ2]|uniref:N-acetylmuramoyl-L-alanine amidase n=1 Tax=Bacillaceae TaxID=186817 RepID=UPI0016432DE3|nr:MULTISPECIES: N-acetylmuramoyl-L-alanine amidase [Bacillaceae]WHX40287.1 N-acetylmuramoyl-L-alanine amidase [Mesobacillus sp. AQ2]